MKKYIAFLITIAMITLIFSSCNPNSNKNQNTNNKNLNKENKISTTVKENYEFSTTKIYYEMRGDYISWDKIENADGYYITINNQDKIKTTDTYYSLKGYKPGMYTVTIEPYDNENVYKVKNTSTKEFRINGFENEVEAKLKATQELVNYIVEIEITKYNKGFLGIKKDKITEITEGVICQKEGTIYTSITYSQLLKDNTKYDNTEIIIRDVYGNKYDGTISEPSSNQIKDGFLTVIKFKQKNKELPVANISKEIGNIEDAILVSSPFSKTTTSAIIVHFEDMQYVRENNLKCRYQVIITDQKWATPPVYKIAFDEFYNFIGITITNSEKNEIRIVQPR